MSWWIKAALAGGGYAIAKNMIARELDSRGVDGQKRDALLGALTLVVYVGVARAMGDEDANPATPE